MDRTCPQQNLHELLELHDWTALRPLLASRSAADLVQVLRSEPASRWVFVIKLLPEQTAGELLAKLSSSEQAQLLEALTDFEAVACLRQLARDDITQILETLPEARQQGLLQALPPVLADQTRAALAFPEASVGRMLDPDCIILTPEQDRDAALEQVRRQHLETPTSDRLFVVSQRGTLLADLTLQRLILAEPSQRVFDLMDRSLIHVRANLDREHAAAIARHYDIEVLPVTDQQGRLLGAVSIDDLLDTQETEATEDFHKLGGMARLDFRLSNAPAVVLYRKRVGWLLMLIAMNVLTINIVASFQTTLQAMLALILFLPLIVDSAGNAGSQAATLTVRGLATGDIRTGDWIWLWSRELAVALALGLTMAVAVYGLGLWRGGPDLALTVALSMVLIVTAGSLIGLGMPLLLQRLGLDPATASTPLVTSVADIIGILIYGSLATVLLPAAA